MTSRPYTENCRSRSDMLVEIEKLVSCEPVTVGLSPNQAYSDIEMKIVHDIDHQTAPYSLHRMILASAGSFWKHLLCEDIRLSDIKPIVIVVTPESESNNAANSIAVQDDILRMLIRLLYTGHVTNCNVAQYFQLATLLGCLSIDKLENIETGVSEDNDERSSKCDSSSPTFPIVNVGDHNGYQADGGERAINNHLHHRPSENDIEPTFVDGVFETVNDVREIVSGTFVSKTGVIRGELDHSGASNRRISDHNQSEVKDISECEVKCGLELPACNAPGSSSAIAASTPSMFTSDEHGESATESNADKPIGELELDFKVDYSDSDHLNPVSDAARNETLTSSYPISGSTSSNESSYFIHLSTPSPIDFNMVVDKSVVTSKSSLSSNEIHSQNIRSQQPLFESVNVLSANFKCSFCKFRAINLDALVSHVLAMSCSSVLRIFDRHVFLSHEAHEVKQYCCCFCKRFVDSRHVVLHAEALEAASTSSQVNDNTQSLFAACSKCHKKFLTPESLHCHQSVDHLTEEGLYKCAVCGGKFNTSVEIVGHFSVHEVIREVAPNSNDDDSRAIDVTGSHASSSTSIVSNSVSSSPITLKPVSSKRFRIFGNNIHPVLTKRNLSPTRRYAGIKRKRKPSAIDLIVIDDLPQSTTPPSQHPETKVTETVPIGCEFCSESCVNDRQLQCHLSLRHSVDSFFVCRLCKVKCRLQAMMRMHLNRVHSAGFS